LSSSEAELLAAVNSISMAIARGVADKGDRIILEADCLHVQHIFERSKRKLSENEQRAFEHWMTLRGKLELSLQFRHVKGHTTGHEPRLWVNNLCDRLARSGLAHARKHGIRQS
jgi:ribonuclease HI